MSERGVGTVVARCFLGIVSGDLEGFRALAFCAMRKYSEKGNIEKSGCYSRLHLLQRCGIQVPKCLRRCHGLQPVATAMALGFNSTDSRLH
jgi:hypothetical protein